MNSDGNSNEIEQDMYRSKKSKRKESKLKSWFEEFKLNQQGKTKYHRIDVMGKHRKVDRFLTGLIIVLLLLNLITLVVVFFY